MSDGESNSCREDLTLILRNICRPLMLERLRRRGLCNQSARQIHHPAQYTQMLFAARRRLAKENDDDMRRCLIADLDCLIDEDYLASYAIWMWPGDTPQSALVNPLKDLIDASVASRFRIDNSTTYLHGRRKSLRQPIYMLWFPVELVDLARFLAKGRLDENTHLSPSIGSAMGNRTDDELCVFLLCEVSVLSLQAGRWVFLDEGGT